MALYAVVWQKFADFTGRAGRAEFWVFSLINALVIFVLQVVEVATGLFASTPIYVMAGLFSLAALLPSLAVSVRRLHDTGKSGLWLLLVFVPVVGALVLFVVFLQSGVNGRNEYGERPR